MTDHLNEITYPPFQVGQRVRIKEDGPAGEIYRITGAVYEYRGVPRGGWDFTLATDYEITNGHGGADGFGPEHIELESSILRTGARPIESGGEAG